jgi:hypothetical protein
MIYKYLALIAVFSWYLPTILGQSVEISGKITDKKGNALFAVNICLLKNNQIGMATGLDGTFRLTGQKEIFQNDSLVISFIGFEKKVISLKKVDFAKKFDIVLSESSFDLDEIKIKAKKTITEEFSVVQLKKMDIYLNPNSSADPLKALTNLPVSTNTDETANPELRGSSASRSMVYLNSVPIQNPVRNSQINGMGFFSIFNTSMIQNQNVYASNPPLMYGNSSAGIIEIETDEEVQKNDLQITASLASIGVLKSTRLNDNNHLWVYGNYQFSTAFKQINDENMKHIKSFSSFDAGLNFHSNLSKKNSMNFYSYLLDENSQVEIQLFTTKGITAASRTRNFNILNFKYLNNKEVITLNIGTMLSKSNFSFGNLNSNIIENQYYSSFNYKRYLTTGFSVQTGITMDYQKNNYKEKSPLFYYAFSPENPIYQRDTILKNISPEAYLYSKWQPEKKITFGIGLRKNLLNQDFNFFSFQSSLKIDVNKRNSLLLAAGKYHNFSYSYGDQRSIILQSSLQVSAEYAYKGRNMQFQCAVYHKNEANQWSEKRKINGLELYFEQFIFKNFRFDVSNTFLNAELDLDSKKYTDETNVKWFLKSTFSYQNQQIANVGISWLFRPGKTFTPIDGALYHSQFDVFEPVYSTQINSGQFSNYSSVNLNASKILVIRKTSVIVFFSVNNLFNSSNQKEIQYNHDYSDFTFSNYQKRIFYGGLVFQLNN